MSTILTPNLISVLNEICRDHLYDLAKSGNVIAIAYLRLCRNDLERLLSTNHSRRILGDNGVEHAWERVYEINELLASVPLVGKTDEAKMADIAEIMNLGDHPPHPPKDPHNRP